MTCEGVALCMYGGAHHGGITFTYLILRHAQHATRWTSSPSCFKIGKLGEKLPTTTGKKAKKSYDDSRPSSSQSHSISYTKMNLAVLLPSYSAHSISDGMESEMSRMRIMKQLSALHSTYSLIPHHHPSSMPSSKMQRKLRTRVLFQLQATFCCHPQWHLQPHWLATRRWSWHPNHLALSPKTMKGGLCWVSCDNLVRPSRSLFIA